MNKSVALTPLGVVGTVGAIQFVPVGYPGAGRLKLCPSATPNWYDATVQPDGNGTYDILGVTQTATIYSGTKGSSIRRRDRPRSLTTASC